MTAGLPLVEAIFQATRVLDYVAPSEENTHHIILIRGQDLGIIDAELGKWFAKLTLTICEIYYHCKLINFYTKVLKLSLKNRGLHF